MESHNGYCSFSLDGILELMCMDLPPSISYIIKRLSSMLRFFVDLPELNIYICNIPLGFFN